MDATYQKIKENISRVLIGQEHVTDLLLTALLAGGHVLLEDVPGMGKTVLARSLAGSVDAKFGRVQFTPDLLPNDVTGLNFYNQKQGEFVFSEGPVFCNILLADEINRATPRTQSSLLECMAEQQVTVDGVTRPLPKPFFVIATQNPVETLGTYPLPEAQLDRFLMRISMDAPTREQEIAILERFKTEQPLEQLTSVSTCEEILSLREQVKQVYVHPLLAGYITDLCQASRKTAGIEVGVSPRGSLALYRAAQSYAFVTRGAEFVTPEDVKAIAVPMLAHRLTVSGAAGMSAPQKQAVQNLLDTTPVPTEDWSK